MQRAVWGEKYESGHLQIDAEHRIFIELIGRIEADIECGAPLERVVRRVTELLKYAEFHFYSEEGLMIDVAFPDTRAHRARHTALADELRATIPILASELRKGRDLVGYLLDWFAAHVAAEDVRVARFILDSGE